MASYYVAMISTGIKDLKKNKLSYYLRGVRRAGPFLITEREKVIATIVHTVERGSRGHRDSFLLLKRALQYGKAASLLEAKNLLKNQRQNRL